MTTKISIVTPCLNSERYLEATIRSVTTPRGGYDLEYIVVDGASADKTLDIIRTNAAHVTKWVSEKDDGLYDGIAKGFELSTGEIMGWINSDDIYYPWTLDLVSRLFATFPEVRWITTLSPTMIDAQGDVAKVRRHAGFARQAFLDGVYVGSGGVGDPGATDCIQQESTFWRRSLWDDARGAEVIRRHALAGDFALWAAFFMHADLYGVEAPLAAFRVRADQMSTSRSDTYSTEVRAALAEARKRANYSFSRGGTDAPTKYPGKYIVKAKWEDPGSVWILREWEFAVLPRSSMKTALYNGLIV